MSDDIPERVGALERSVNSHASAIQRINTRQDHMDRVIEDLQKGQSSMQSTLSAMREDVHAMTHEALRSWPEAAVQKLESEREAHAEALESERTSSGRINTLLVAICGGLVSLLGVAIFVIAKTHA